MTGILHLTTISISAPPKGIELTANSHLQVAAALARGLTPDHAPPEGREYSSVEELPISMMGAWKFTATGLLFYRQGDNQRWMSVGVDNNALLFVLCRSDGPFFSFVMMKKEEEWEWQALVPPKAQALVAREPALLFSAGEYLLPVIGWGTCPSDPFTVQAVCAERIENFESLLRLWSNKECIPQQTVALLEKALAFFRDQLAADVARNGDLLEQARVAEAERLRAG